MSNFNGLIIEGYSYTGKTSLLKELKSYHSNNDMARSNIILSEHYTQVLNINHKNEVIILDKEQHIKLLNSHVMMINNLYDWINSEIMHNKPSSDLFYIIERFHLNHRVTFSDSYSIIDIENKMLKFNPLCVLLIVSEPNIKKRINYRYPNSDKIFVDNEYNNFIEFQNKYIDSYKKSNIPTIVINTDSMDWRNITLQIFNEI